MSWTAFRGYVWLVEAQDDSGDWYQCGYDVHRTRKAALVEMRVLGGGGPKRVTRYVPTPQPRDEKE